MLLDTNALVKFLSSQIPQMGGWIFWAVVVFSFLFAFYMQKTIAQKVPFIVRYKGVENLKTLRKNAILNVIAVGLISVSLAVYSTVIEVQNYGNSSAHTKNAAGLDKGNELLKSKLKEIENSYTQQRKDIETAKAAEVKTIESKYTPKIDNLRAKAKSVVGSSPDWAKGMNGDASALESKMNGEIAQVEKKYATQINDLNELERNDKVAAQTLKSEAIALAQAGANIQLGQVNRLSYFLGGFTLVCFLILIFNIHGRALAAKEAGEDMEIMLGKYEESVNLNNFFHACNERFLWAIKGIMDALMAGLDGSDTNKQFSQPQKTPQKTNNEFSQPQNPTPIIGFRQEPQPKMENELNVQFSYMEEQKREAERVLASKPDSSEKRAQTKEVAKVEIPIPTPVDIKILEAAKRDFADKKRINEHRQKTQLGKGSRYETTQRNIEAADEEISKVNSLIEGQRKQINIYDVIDNKV